PDLHVGPGDPAPPREGGAASEGPPSLAEPSGTPPRPAETHSDPPGSRPLRREGARPVAEFVESAGQPHAHPPRPATEAHPPPARPGLGRSPPPSIAVEDEDNRGVEAAEVPGSPSRPRPVFSPVPHRAGAEPRPRPGPSRRACDGQTKSSGEVELSSDPA